MSSEAGVRTAVVTGGTGVLGRAVVAELAGHGFFVHVPWRSDGSAEDLRTFLGDAAGRVETRRADLTHPDEVERFFRPLFQTGRLDLLCNLAGGFVAGPVDDTAPSSWAKMLEMNATSTFLATRAAVPLLRIGGGGSIVNVGAVPPLEGGGAGMSAYTASKASVLALTRAWAKELRGDGIRVNAVAPEIIDTPSNRRAMPGADRSTWLKPAEVASVIAFLASDAARVITGTVLAMRGGS